MPSKKAWATDAAILVLERDEVGVFGEAVHDGEDDQLAAHLEQPFDEVHRDVRPYLRGHLERLQQPCWRQGRCLVALARGAVPHPIGYQGSVAWNIEFCPEPMQSLLGALMANAMRQLEGLVTEVAEVGHKDAGTVPQKARILVPWCR
jgi:hypothetical protein